MEKYRCVQALQRQAVEQVCLALEISRSGYYDWQHHKPGRRERSNQALRRKLVELHEKYPALGLDSLHHMLKPEFGCSRKRVHRQMRLAGIASARRYIPTGEGWLYLAIVKDLCTRKIVGYAFSERIDTSLTLEALDMAVRRCKPPKGLIFHSDRGVQYAAAAFRERLECYGIRQSMSRKGDPYDNAVAENFFSCLKCELIHLNHYPTRASAQADIFAYLETFYNSVRPHSALGWLSPTQFEESLLASQAA